VKWVHHYLSKYIKHVHDIDELDRHWLHDKSSVNHAASASSNANSENIKVLLLTDQNNPQLFLAALSIKFTGHIKFGMFYITKENSDAVRKKLNMPDLRIPSYVIITPERTVVYGRRPSEHFNFASMNLFLRTVHPEMYDVFLCCLLLVNMLVFLQIFQVCNAMTFGWKVCVLFIQGVLFIQYVPLATKPGVSLIILTLMRNSQLDISSRMERHPTLHMPAWPKFSPFLATASLLLNY
jgi:hypothetical protein